jgi:hypothetical protein
MDACGGIARREKTLWSPELLTGAPIPPWATLHRGRVLSASRQPVRHLLSWSWMCEFCLARLLGWFDRRAVDVVFSVMAPPPAVRCHRAQAAGGNCGCVLAVGSYSATRIGPHVPIRWNQSGSSDRDLARGIIVGDFKSGSLKSDPMTSFGFRFTLWADQILALSWWSDGLGSKHTPFDCADLQKTPPEFNKISRRSGLWEESCRLVPNFINRTPAS